jgi:hypothetical protein
VLFNDQRLLGRLAQLAWFTANGEPTATRALGFLLEHRVLRDATLAYLTAVTGVDLDAIQRFASETVNVDGGRTDLEGLDIGGKPLLLLEAKFGAHLSQGQVNGYLSDQIRRLDGLPGVLVLLVPESRTVEARGKADIACGESSSSIRPVTLSWGQLVDIWKRASSDDAGLAGDVEQFAAMCHTLGGMVIAPLAAAAGGGNWRTRFNDLAQIIDATTRTFDQRAPIGDEPLYSRRRYFPSGYSNFEGEPKGAASIGIAEEFADAGLSPIWLRIHKATDCFTMIRDRLVASPFRDAARVDHGHLWLPLTIDPDLPGPDLVASLSAQVEAIRTVASGESGN